MEFHHLNEIDIKLQVLLSDGDFSAISSSCSKLPSQIYQVYYTTELTLQISCLKCVLRSNINENTACVCTCVFFFLNFSLVSSICSRSICVKE